MTRRAKAFREGDGDMEQVLKELVAEIFGSGEDIANDLEYGRISNEQYKNKRAYLKRKYTKQLIKLVKDHN